MKTNMYFQSHFAQLFLDKKKLFQTKVVEKFETQILCSIYNFLFKKSCLLLDNVGKKNVSERGQATEEIMARAHCMLDT